MIGAAAIERTQPFGLLNLKRRSLIPSNQAGGEAFDSKLNPANIVCRNITSAASPEAHSESIWNLLDLNNLQIFVDSYFCFS